MMNREQILAQMLADVLDEVDEIKKERIEETERRNTWYDLYQELEEEFKELRKEHEELKADTAKQETLGILGEEE